MYCSITVSWFPSCHILQCAPPLCPVLQTFQCWLNSFMFFPTSKGSSGGDWGPCSWQRAFINDRSPTLLWIAGPWQTIAVVGTLEEQRRFLKRPRPADRCCWKDEQGVRASLPSQVWRRQGWQNTCNVLAFTLMTPLYRLSYTAIKKRYRRMRQWLHSTDMLVFSSYSSNIFDWN